MAATRTPWLHVIAGCMSSGKTAEVVRLLSRREIAGQSVLLITPARDTRVAPGEVVSRTGTRFPSVVAKDAASLRDEVLARDPDAVAVEEAQFFGPDLPAIIEEIVAGPRTVIVSGLDQDFA
ncbi:MAG: thymidine kinase, partial [Candidatus Limnocylindrus sp.]